MVIRFLNKKTEVEKVNKWLPKKVSARELPGHIFCAVVDDKIIAMAGLRLMEGEVCFIDSMATDQSVEGAKRHEALDELTKALLDMAKNLGFKKVFATTKEDCIIKRAERHGFKLSDQQVIVREL